ITTGNAPPVASDDTASTPIDTPVSVDVLANDSDPDGTLDPASVAVFTGPAHGGTTVDPTTGAITYTPASGYQGADSFTYTVDDDDVATSNVATVNITIGTGGLNTFFPSSTTVEAGTGLSGTASDLASDNDVYFVVRSNKATSRTATWFGSFTGIDNATSPILVTYTGKASATCTQVISIWRWTDSSWVQLDSRSIGTSEVEVADLSPP